MTKYPNSIDTNLELPSIIDNVSEISGETINALIEAVIQIEKVLGVNPHGTTLDLTTRLSQILNDDGTFKSAALISSGLISLPITNSQIGASAAIEESKLDLDIATQSLQDQINLNEVDIATLQNSLAILITRVSRHVLALAERHDGYDIDISGLTSAPSISTVGQALVFIRDTFLSHVAATATVEHYASAISYEPEENGVILSTNVQDAIAEFDNTFKESRRQHNSSAHSSGISNDGYIIYGNQAAVNDASARLSTYKSVGARNIVKIGLINSATIKSKDFNPNNLNATTGDAIDIVVRCGDSTKEINITGLNSVEYPALSGRPNLTAVVTYLNTQFASNTDNFPVTAFASDDGQIVLQHNISREDCSITISGPVGTSAVEELGFSEIENVEIFKENIYTLYVNGNPYSELEISTDGYSYQIASSNDMELEDDLSTLSLFANSLIHIYNHTNPDANGTYRIAVAPGSGTTITLGSALADGYYNYIVYKDSFDLPNTGPDTRLLELFLDKDLNPVSYNKIEEASSIFGILGLKITEISENFPIGACTLNYTNASSLITTSLQIGANVGAEVVVSSSYLGEWILYAPDNYNFVRVLKVGSTAIGTNNISFDVLESNKTIDKLLLGYLHDSLGNTFELPTNKINVGLSGVDSIGSDFISEYIENSLGLLHSSGVIKGFATSFDPGGLIDIDGGICFVGGKKIVKNYTQIQTLHIAASNDTWNLYLDKFGNYRIFNEDDAIDPEYSFRNIINSTEYIAICQFVRSGGVISAISDARFFIDQNEQKLELTVASDNSIRKAKFQTLSAAKLYASAYSSSASKTEIIVLADLEINETGRIPADTSVKVFGNLTAISDLYVEDNAKLEIFGDVYIDGQTYLNFQSNLVIHGNANFTISDAIVNMYSGSTLQFENPRDTGENEILLDRVIVDGYNVSIIGANSKSRLKFNTTSNRGIYINNSKFFTMKNCFLQRGTSVDPLLELNLSDDFVIDNCIFTDSATFSISLASIATGYIGVKLVGEVFQGQIKNCLFKSISNAIDQSTLISYNLDISNNKFISCGEAVVLANGFNVSISNNLFEGLHSVGINIENNDTDKITNLNIVNNTFQNLFSDTNSSPNVIKTLVGAYNVNISNNSFHSLINSVSPIDYVMNITGENIIIDSNAIYDTRSDDYLINLNGVDTSCTVSSNTVTNHHGPLLIARNASIVGNSFNDISNGGQTITINAASYDGYSSVFSGNRVISTDMNDNIYMQGVNISQNNIVVGNAYFVDSDIDGNTLNLVGTPADGYGLLLSNTNRTDHTSFTNNWVKSIASTSAVSTINGKYNISGNNFALNTSGQRPLIALSLGSGTTNAQDNTLVTSNIFTVGSAYGLWIDASYVSCIGNNFFQTPGSHDVYITNTRTNVYITNNHFRMGSSGVASVFHQATSPTGCLFRFNKNCLDRYVYSTIDALTSGTWTTNISLPGTIQLTSGAGINRVAVSLNSLPQGSELYSVIAHVLTPGTAGDINVRLLYRSSSSLTTADLASSLGVNSVAVSYQEIEITPSSRHYVNSANEYILLITSNVASNSLGQVVAYIKN